MHVFFFGSNSGSIMVSTLSIKLRLRNYMWVNSASVITLIRLILFMNKLLFALGVTMTLSFNCELHLRNFSNNCTRNSSCYDMQTLAPSINVTHHHQAGNSSTQTMTTNPYYYDHNGLKSDTFNDGWSHVIS